MNVQCRYVENGSLESLLRKHGRFPESVCLLSSFFFAA
jgi:hypothetical protein